MEPVKQVHDGAGESGGVGATGRMPHALFGGRAAACCRRACITRTNQRSALNPHSFMLCTAMHVCTAVYSRLRVFFIDCPLWFSSFFSYFLALHPYCRSERNIASEHTAQHRAISSALQVVFGMIKSLVESNHGSVLSAPVTFFSCILPRASVAGC